MNPQDRSQPGRKLGQGMLISSFVVGLAGMAFIFDGMLERQFNPNKAPTSFENSEGLREVVLEQNRQGHYVASGTINDDAVVFLLDTGATDVAIPGSVAERAGLIAGSQSLASTANGVVPVFSTTINKLTIGNILLTDVRASIAPNMPGETILLGMSALRQVEFSQRGSSLTLKHFSN